MKIWLCLLGYLEWGWHFCMYDLAKLYELLFLIFQYDYIGVHELQYRKELSWREKIICFDRYATDEMMAVLRDIEKIPSQKMLSHRENRETKEIDLLGRHCVLKSGVQKGFFKPLFSMGLGIDIWNNAQWLKKKGFPVLTPIAMIEKRKWNHTESFVVYLYEGVICEDELKQRDHFFPQIQEIEKKLYQEGVIHHDFRLRNMVILEDGRVQLIDIDKVHWYPRNSCVFYQRMKREVRKFNKNMALETGYTGQIEA